MGHERGDVGALRYGVRFASDDEMPEGHDALVIQSADEAIVFYRESVVNRAAVTTAWGALHALAAEGRPMPADELMLRRASRLRGGQRLSVDPRGRWAISER